MSTVDELAREAMAAAAADPSTFREAPEAISLRIHLVTDALHRIADLHAQGRVKWTNKGGGLTYVRATDHEVAADIAAGMDQVEVDEHGREFGWLLNGIYVVSVDPPRPDLAELVAAAALLPDSLPDGASC